MQAPKDAQGSAEGEENNKGTPGDPGGPDPTGALREVGTEGATARDSKEDQGTGQGPLPESAPLASTEDSTEEMQEVYPS